MTQAAEALPDDPKTLKAMLIAERERAERLIQIIKDMQRHRFGRRAESLPEDQLLLALEDVEQNEAEAAAETEAKSSSVQPEGARKRRANRGALPAHLPRVETLVDVDDKTCPCCKGALHRIGEDVSERLDVVPAQFRVLVVHRPKYACRACESVVVQSSAPARLIWAACRPRPWSPTCSSPNTLTICRSIARRKSTSARAFVSTARRSPTGSGAPRSICGRSTSASWRTSSPRRSCSPTRRRRRCSIRGVGGPRPASSGPMRGTISPGAEPTRRRSPMSTRPTARRRSRSRISPASRASFRSTATPDIGRSRARAMSRSPSAGRTCGAVSTSAPSPKARRSPTRPCQRIAALYRIEADIRGCEPDKRRAIRQERSRPIVAELEPWLREKLPLLSRKSKLAQAIRYGLSHWDGLIRFLDDGRIEIDSNTVERSIRPLALTRKNALFAGSDGGAESWAVVASLIETCKLNDVDPYAYLADTLTRIVDGHRASAIDDLLPWAYPKPQPLKHAA